MMKRIITIMVGGALVSLIFLAAHFFWIPNFPLYDQQKKYAAEIQNSSDEIHGIGLFASNVTIARVIHELLTKPLKNKSLRAYEALFRLYPTEANNDVDALRRYGYSLKDVKRYKEAIDLFRKDIDIFKQKHFEKYEALAKGRSYSYAKKIEYIYIAESYWAIGACYNALGKYENGIKEYQKVLEFMPETLGLDEYDRSQIFEIFYITIAKSYKIKFKQYDKAISLYTELANEFPKYSGLQAFLLIGDTYLAMGDIQEAKKIYEEAVIKYKYPGSDEDFRSAEKKLNQLHEGKVYGSDGVVYEIQNGNVKIRFI